MLQQGCLLCLLGRIGHVQQHPSSVTELTCDDARGHMARCSVCGLHSCLDALCGGPLRKNRTCLLSHRL